MSTYILQKHLPDCNAGCEFTQTEDGENYVCYESMAIPAKWSIGYNKQYVENNPNWFKKKEPDPIQDAINLLQKEGFGIIPLNFDSKAKMFSRGFPLYYTEEDMRKCFYAPIHIDGGGRSDTFEDYIKTIR